jgi:GntR family transcriptional regulator
MKPKVSEKQSVDRNTVNLSTQGKIVMLRNNAIPLYYQLETILRKKIISGEFSPKAPLPSEEMLSGEYQVSRITVRQALASLEKEGYILRQRGRGTFVSEKINKIKLLRISAAIEDLIITDIPTKTKLLDTRWIKPPDIVKERLKIVKNQKVLRIEKVRNIESTPFSHVYIYLPVDIGKRLSRNLFKKAMLILLEEELGIRATEAQQFVGATIADTVQASILDVRVGDPLLKVERTVFGHKKNPIQYVSMVLRADHCAFNMKLKRKGNSNSAGWGTV